MQAATLTEEPPLRAEAGAVSAGEPDQEPSLPAGLGCPTGQEQGHDGSHKQQHPEGKRSGQTEGGTAAGKAGQTDYKDEGAARALGKSLVMLIKVQDWLMTTANNSIQDIPEFNREMEEKFILISKQHSGFPSKTDRMNETHNTASFPGHQSRLDRGYSRQQEKSL